MGEASEIAVRFIGRHDKEVQHRRTEANYRTEKATIGKEAYEQAVSTSKASGLHVNIPEVEEVQPVIHWH
jgi:hypothetical protein